MATSVYLSKKAWLWPAAIAVLIFAASSRPRVAGPDIEGIDKVAHFGVFGLLATLVCRMPAVGWRTAVWSAVAVSAFGVTDEWHQGYVPGREPDWHDWIADTAGAGLAVTVYTGATWYRRVLEYPIWDTARGRRVRRGDELVK